MIILGSKVNIILAWNSPMHWIVRLEITAASGVKHRVLNLVLQVLAFIFPCFCVCVSKCTALQSFNKINPPRTSEVFC